MDPLHPVSFAASLRRLAWPLAAASMLAWAGCSASDSTPLGGPFGGTSTSANPTQNVAAGLTPRPTPPLDAGPPYVRTGPPPTFSQLFDSYFGTSAPGGPCSQCHSAMDSAADAFVWLQSQAQVGSGGTTPPIIDPAQSCMTYFGGGMPPAGPTADPAANADFEAWAQAGAQNN